MTEVNIDSITVAERYRKDLGDLTDLKASIESIGFLHAIVVDSNLRLIAGARRLEAAKQLGIKRVPVRVVDRLSDAAHALTAERDENTCRKEMTISEKVAIGKALEELERAKAKKRQGKRNDLEHPVKFTRSSKPSRDAVGEAIGMSGVTFQRAKAVIEAAEDMSLPPETREAAIEAKAHMDRTGKVSAAHEKVQTAKNRDRVPASERFDEIASLAESGHLATQIASKLGISAAYVRQLARTHKIRLPDATIGRQKAINPHRVISETVNILIAATADMDLISKDDMPSMGKADRLGWIEGINEAMKSINWLRKALKESIQ